MAVTQSVYRDRLVAGLHGQIATTSLCQVDSYVLEGDDNVAFGTMVYQGTEDKLCGQVTANAANYLGLTVKDPTRYPGDGNMYVPGADVNVLVLGDMYLEAAGPVSAFDAPYFNPADGVVGRAGSVLTGGAHGTLAVLQALNRSGLSYDGTALAAEAFTGHSFEEMAAFIQAGINAQAGVSGIGVVYDGVRFIVRSDNATAVEAFTGGASDDFGINVALGTLVSQRAIQHARWVRSAAQNGIGLIRLGSTTHGA
jgi:hypothetical protein